MCIPRVGRSISFVWGSFPPYAVGRDFGQNLLEFRFAEPVEPGQPWPHQNLPVLCQKRRGKEKKHAAAQHDVDYFGSRAQGFTGDESGDQYIGVDKGEGVRLSLLSLFGDGGRVPEDR